MNFFEDAELSSLLKSLETKPFNFFQTVESLLGENAISRMISYYMDSESNHGMGLTLPFAVSEDLKKKRGLKQAIVEPSETESKFNWSTHKGRFIDIVTIYKNEKDEPLLVVGVETKIWAGEQKNQVKDYQSALAKKFPNCPTALIFLSPSGYYPDTAEKRHRCPVHAYDYGTFAKLICKASETNRAGSDLLRQIGEHMKTGYTKTISNEDKVKIKTLWENHKESLEQIVYFGKRVKTPRYFLTELLPSHLSSLDLSEVAFIQWTYPRRSAIPYEYNFVLNDINKLLKQAGQKFEIYYMIYNKNRAPEEDPYWDIRLMAYWGDGESKPARKFAETYSKKHRLELNGKNQWLPWICLELGEQLDFGNFSRKDAEKLSKKIRDFEKRTYKKLLACL